MSQTNFQSKEAAVQSRRWKLIDAKGLPVGRVASTIASIVRGKTKANFTPHVAGGDYVIVVNADKVVFTGNKAVQKVYRDHSGYFGGVRERTAEKLLQERPAEVLRRAVWGMLPKGPLGRDMLTQVKIYKGSAHPHKAQAPEAVTVKAGK
ncbi:MAG: 50S ribosomal protein L13 [Bdellovibrionota bacterium]|nr:MAG: 50S ribosomal protein L13 [Bdellovibrionota bacterium]